MALGTLLMGASSDVAAAGAADAAGSVLSGGMFGGIPAASWLNAGSAVLGRALSPSSAGPSRADSGADSGDSWFSQSFGFDSSGWTVATGKSQAEGGARSQGVDLSQWALIGLAALAVVAWVRTKKS